MTDLLSLPLPELARWVAWVETQRLGPWWYSIQTASTQLPSAISSRNFRVPSSLDSSRSRVRTGGGEVYEVQRQMGRPVSSLVLMGIGEPLDNLQNVLDFLTILCSPEGQGLGYRHISLSTCGLVPGIPARKNSSDFYFTQFLGERQRFYEKIGLVRCTCCWRGPSPTPTPWSLTRPPRTPRAWGGWAPLSAWPSSAGGKARGEGLPGEPVLVDAPFQSPVRGADDPKHGSHLPWTPPPPATASPGRGGWRRRWPPTTPSAAWSRGTPCS